MGKSISDRIASKLSGKDIQTIYVSKEDMVNMVDRVLSNKQLVKKKRSKF